MTLVWIWHDLNVISARMWSDFRILEPFAVKHFILEKPVFRVNFAVSLQIFDPRYHAQVFFSEPISINSRCVIVVIIWRWYFYFNWIFYFEKESEDSHLRTALSLIFLTFPNFLQMYIVYLKWLFCSLSYLNQEGRIFIRTLEKTIKWYVLRRYTKLLMKINYVFLIFFLLLVTHWRSKTSIFAIESFVLGSSWSERSPFPLLGANYWWSFLFSFFIQCRLF